jgi:hypothetical protein
VRVHRQNRTTPTCHDCRNPRRELTPEQRARYQRWWVEQSGLDLDELLEIAAGLAPE